MTRLIRLSLLAGAATVAFPAAAAAQFYPSIVPPNPLYQHPAYSFQFSIGVRVPTVFGPAFVGMTAPSTRAPQLFSPYLYSGPTNRYTGPAWQASMNYQGNSVSPGYITGGAIQSDAFASAQRAYMKAQHEASLTSAFRNTPDPVKDAIYDQWAYENLGVLGLPALKGGQNQPDQLIKALAVTDERDVASGDTLNHILVAIVAAENKGAKGPSAFLPPQVLDVIRFTGSPAADAINLIRQAGHLPFPAAFNDPKLKDSREAIEKDFASAVAPLRDGKAADPMKLLKLGITLKKAQDAAAPVIRTLPFEEATAAHRFFNRFEKALAPMKGASATFLINPAWAAEGTSIADLVKYMAKNKLLFGPVPVGNEVDYLALHKGLSTYLIALTQPKK